VARIYEQFNYTKQIIELIIIITKRVKAHEYLPQRCQYILKVTYHLRGMGWRNNPPHKHPDFLLYRKNGLTTNLARGKALNREV
jgi:hypothetical protein